MSCLGFSKISVKGNDLDKLKLYGKVKSITEFSYEALVKSGQIVKGNRVKENVSVSNYYEFPGEKVNIGGISNYNIKFNVKGFKTEEIWYLPNGSLDKKRTFRYDDIGIISGIKTYSYQFTESHEIVYHYNSERKLIKEEEYDIHIPTENKTLENTIAYKYYDDGKLYRIEQGRPKLSSRNNYKFYLYDKKGRLIELQDYTYYDNTIYCKRFNYNENDDIVEEFRFFVNLSDVKVQRKTYYKSDGTSVTTYDLDPFVDLYLMKFDSKYDDLHYPIEQTMSRPHSWNVYVKRILKYDENRNVISRKIFNNNSDYERYVLIYDIKYVYVYDERGNWKYRTEYDFNKPSIITERKIEYF